jgi:hypothetical protein
MIPFKTRVAVQLSVDDPHDLEPIKQAYCVLVEVHMNFELEAIVAVFKCWKSEQAFLSDRKAFHTIQVPFPPEEGGKAFFEKWGADEASVKLSEHLRNHCLLHSVLAKAKVVSE